MTPNLRRFKIPDLRRFMTPDVHRFDHPATDSKFTRNSQIQLLFSHITWKLISWNPVNPTFRGCKIFPEFPNTSPSGKRVDSDNSIPQKLSDSGKKRHPRNIGVDKRPPGISQRSNRGGFLKLPPHPYKYIALTVKISSLPRFFQTFACIFAENHFATKCSQLQDFPNSQRYFFLCSFVIIFTFQSLFATFVLHTLFMNVVLYFLDSGSR
jgi:hypothetical protein